MNHRSKNIEWKKISEIVSKSLESWRQSPNTKQSFQRKPPVLWGEKRIHRQLSLTRSFAWSIYASVLFSSFGSRSHFQHQTVDNGFTQKQRRSLREAKSWSNRAQIETYSHQSVPNTFLHQMLWFSIAGRDTRAKTTGRETQGSKAHPPSFAGRHSHKLLPAVWDRWRLHTKRGYLFSYRGQYPRLIKAIQNPGKKNLFFFFFNFGFSGGFEPACFFLVAKFRQK